MGTVKIDLSGLKKFEVDLQRTHADTDAFFKSCAKELAARLLAKVIKRTPTGDSTYKMTDITDADGNKVTYKRGKRKGEAKQKKEKMHHGGTLRRGWTAKTEAEAENGGSGNAVSFAETLQVEKVGNQYQITIINPVAYASYVEYGHRQTPGRFVGAIGKRLKKSWVPGQFMLTISEQELRSEVPAIVERKMEAFLRGVLGAQ